MKNLLIILALVLTGGVLRAEEKTETLFNKNEVGLSLGGNLLVRDASDKWGGVLGFHAFPFQKFVGAEVSTTVRDLSGTFIDNGRADLILRLPLEKYRLALSLRGGIGYKFGVDDVANAYQLGAGPELEYRFNSKFGVFGNFRHDFERESLPKHEQINFGIRLNF